MMLSLHCYWYRIVPLQDSICTAGLRTTAGSRVLDSYLPPFDATAVARLKAAGAVLIGKTNLDEFCMGSSTENSAYQVSPQQQQQLCQHS
jgi:aspartyl-tRNA(Asn)/glutamyl-tRNA(Gln) amidotransferase subunit A